MLHQRRRRVRDVSWKTQRQPSLAQIRRRWVSPAAIARDERLRHGGQRAVERVAEVPVTHRHAPSRGTSSTAVRARSTALTDATASGSAGRPATRASTISRIAARISWTCPSRRPARRGGVAARRRAASGCSAPCSASQVIASAAVGSRSIGRPHPSSSSVFRKSKVSSSVAAWRWSSIVIDNHFRGLTGYAQEARMQ